MIRFFALSALFSFVFGSLHSQVTLTSRTVPSYTLTINLSTSSLVNKSCSAGSFTYQPLITYEMIFSGTPDNSLATCTGELRCSSGGSTFSLPLTGGVGTILGKITSYSGSVPCSQATPSLLQCNNYSLFIAGADFYTTATSIYSQAIALPLYLISFDARDEQGRVHLYWKVTTDKPDLRFELQASSDARTWNASGAETISSRAADGINFSAYEMRPLSGIRYYRIRQIDGSGSESFSKIIAVRAESDISIVKISPNPVVNNQLRIEGFDNIDDWRMDAVNMSGQPVLSIAAGKSILDVANLPSGIYALRLTHKNTGEVKRLMFSKK